MSFSKILTIINPAAGQDEPILAVMNRAFREASIEWDVRLTHATGDGARLAQAATEQGYDLIAVYGGDGTVMDAVNGVQGTDMPIAILPGGTGNGVAVAINIPDTLECALEQIVAGDGRMIACDVGQIDDRYFLLRVDVGNIVEQIEAQEREDKNQFGMWAYVQAILQAWLSKQDIRFELTLDEREIERSGSAFMIMNMSRVGAFKFNLSDKIRPDDGLLDIFVLKDEVKALASVAASATNLVDFRDMFEHFQAKRIHIETAQPMTVLADGEPFTKTPTTVEIIPSAVRLFVPKIEQDAIEADAT